MKRLSTEALNVLGRSTVGAVSLALPPGQLDRKLYVEVNKALEAIGGEWNKRAKVHRFHEDPEGPLSEILAQGGYTDVKQDLGFFETPEPLASNLVAAAEIKPGMLVLEPSAGRGALVRRVLQVPKVEAVAVEIQQQFYEPLHTILLDARNDTDDVLHGDFLKMDFEELRFDRAVMNPPFRGQADIDHVTKAFGLLKPGGRLVAIMSSGTFFRENAKAKDFRALLELNEGTQYPNADDAFKASGTNVRTVTVIMEKA